MRLVGEAPLHGSCAAARGGRSQVRRPGSTRMTRSTSHGEDRRTWTRRPPVATDATVLLAAQQARSDFDRFLASPAHPGSSLAAGGLRFPALRAAVISREQVRKTITSAARRLTPAFSYSQRERDAIAAGWSPSPAAISRSRSPRRSGARSPAQAQLPSTFAWAWLRGARGARPRSEPWHAS